MRFDVRHEFIEFQLAVELHQLAESSEVKVEKNAVANFPPFFQVILTTVEAYARRSFSRRPPVE